jgi:UDP-3-O-[3-hydroxymyristoyl] glucosamine N-acyltransferase
MITIKELRNFLEVEPLGESDDVFVTRVSSLQDADENTLVWIKGSLLNKNEVIQKTIARVLIVPEDNEISAVPGKVIFKVKNPRLSFIKVIQEFFVEKIIPEIHPTAFVHSKAIVDASAYIGPFTYIGNSRIGANTVIHGNVHVYDNVEIGKGVTIHSGTVIGADGFGYEKDDEGEVFKFPHIGGVVIEENVEIGSNTCIDKGSLGNTIIKKGAKIDNLVHIAHNVEVGENAFVIANAMVGGSTKIGDNTWVAPSVSLMNGISIGKGVTIGMSSLVTKSIPEGETYAGSPAKPLVEFIEMQKKLKKL